MAVKLFVFLGWFALVVEILFSSQEALHRNIAHSLLSEVYFSDGF